MELFWLRCYQLISSVLVTCFLTSFSEFIEMKAKILVYLCVALLPYSIHGAYSSGGSVDGPLNEDVERMERLAQSHSEIDGIFRPSTNGLLGEGSNSFLYRGTLLRPVHLEVAMKFTPRAAEHDAHEEYQIYTYLGSVNDPNIESYGIPKVHFYGQNGQYVMMALTLLDPVFQRKVGAGWRSGQLNVMDILIVCRELVRITKYIHSRSVVHNDLRYENIMFLRGRVFVIDYSLSQRMYGKDENGQKFVLPANAVAERRQFAREDWKKFLFSMCEVVGVQLAWFDEWTFDENLQNEELEAYIEHLKNDVPAIMQQIHQIESEKLRRVFVELAEIVFEDRLQLQNRDEKELIHDYMDRIISEEIESPNPVVVSWLKPGERYAAVQELRTMSTPIASIKNPFALEKVEFPPLNFNHFFRPKRPSSDAAGPSGSKRR